MLAPLAFSSTRQQGFWLQLLFIPVLAGTWRRQWHPTPLLLPGKSHGRKSLEGCSPWGRWESDTTEWLHFHFSLSCLGEGNGNPLQCSCLENPRNRGAWWAAVYGVAQSQTWLMLLSSRSSRDRLHGFMKIFMKYCGMNKGQDKFPDVNCIPVQVQTLWMKKIYILFPRPGNVRRQQLTHMDSVKGKNRGVKHCR